MSNTNTIESNDFAAQDRLLRIVGVIFLLAVAAGVLDLLGSF